VLRDKGIMAVNRVEQTTQLISGKNIAYAWMVLIGLGLGGLSLVVSLPILAGVLATLGVAMLILHNPYWGLLGYIVIFFVRPQEIWTSLGGQFPIERTVALAVLAATAVSPRVRMRNKLIFSPTTAAVLGFAAVLFVVSPFALWRSQALDMSIEFSKTAIIFFLITQLCDTPKRIRIFAWVFLLCHFWLAGSSIYNYYANPAYIRMGIQRAKGLALGMGDPNALAASLSFSIPFVLSFLKTYRKPIMRAFLLGFLGLTVYAIIFTGSRSGMVTLIVLAFILAFRSRHKFPAMVGTVALLLSIWMVMPQMYQDRFMTMFDAGEDEYGARESAMGRWQGFQMGLKIFLDRPFFGAGPGNFPVAWAEFYTIDGKHKWLQSHNMLAQLIGELGAVGLISFGIFLFLAVRANRRILTTFSKFARPPPELFGLQAIATAIYVGFVLLIVSGLFGHNLYRYNWYYYAALLVAIELVLGNFERQSAEAAVSTAETTGRKTVKT